MKYKALTVFVVCALVLLTVISAVYASAPTIDSIANQDATVGNEFSLTVTGSSTDGNPIAFEAQELSCLTCAASSTFPDGSLVYRAAEEAELLWTPTPADVGQHEIQVRSYNSAGDESFETFSISVTDPNDQPVIGPILDRATTEQHTLSFEFTVRDLDADDTISVATSSSVSPSSSTLVLQDAISYIGMAENNKRRFSFSWTPTVADRGTHQVTLLMTDGSFPSNPVSFDITVAANQPAQISTRTLADATQSQAYSQTIVATDANEDTLTFSLGSNAPSGMSIGSSSGVISWTPTDAQVGSASFTVSVTDGIQEAPTQRTYTIDVIDTNDLPVLETSSFTVEEGNSLSATLVVVDGDGDAVTLVSGPTTTSTRASEDVVFGDFTLVSTGRYSMSITWDSTVSSDLGQHSFTAEFNDGTASVTRTFTLEVTEDISDEEARVRDLEDEFDLIDDDVNEFEDDLDRAIRRDDDNDIDDAKDNLEDLRDNELDDLRSDVEDELEDVQDNDDLDNDLQDDLEDRLNDLLDDIDALEEDIDNLVDCERRSCSSSSTTSSNTYVPYTNIGTTGSTTGGSSGSSTNSGSTSSEPQVTVVTVPAPTNSGITGATTTTTEGINWEDFRWIFLMGAAIVVAFAVLIFLLALAFSGSKKRRR